MRRLNFGLVFTFLTPSSAFAGPVADYVSSQVSDFNEQNCIANMSAISKKIDSMKPEDYLKEIQSGERSQLLDKLWKNKLSIHEKLRSFYQEGFFMKDCADTARSAFRSIRTLEDHVNEDLIRKNDAGLKFPDNAWEAGNVHVKRNPKFSKFEMMKDLKSGDVILTRGNAYTSAAISQLGGFDTQFSHMSMVYKDEQGKFWTVEAHIEVGVFVRPLQEHIDDKNFRTMIFRYDDEVLAAEAAKLVFNKVKTHTEKYGNIKYDFGFQTETDNKLFCSEVVSHAFDLATQGQVSIPIFRSRLMKRKPEFVKNLEIKADESFIPADIEIDPRFTVVSEWRDANRLNDSLQKDAVLMSIYKWHEDFGYQMIQGSSKKSFIYRNIAWPMRRIPLLKIYFKDKFPINMSRKLLGYFGVIDTIGEYLQGELKLAEEAVVAKRGLPMTYAEKMETLDAIRLKDLDAKKKKLHKWYKPRKTKG